MTERLLQFIWQFQYFNKQELTTHDDTPLQIIHPGKYNTHQGPDFLEGSIKAGNTILVGNIELHLKTSDWVKHGHNADKHYSNVILHVVWQHDEPAEQPANIPVLELESLISNLLLRQYDEWMQKSGSIACAASVSKVSSLVWSGWQERLLAERLQRKTGYILQLLEANDMHWEETCWQLLARNFGMKVNAAAFETIAQSLPIKILARHKQQPIVLEALLQGQAGLLEGDFSEDYPLLLQREYRYHQHKYKLKQPAVVLHFLRMRPVAFPGIRLAQLAMLVHQAVHLFASIREAASFAEIKELLNVKANDYWHYHYQLDVPSAYCIKNLGESMLNNILINTICPLLFAYGLYHKDQAAKDRAIDWLSNMPAEKNNIIKGWQELGINCKTAQQGQSLIELKTQYCDEKRCLDCAVGNALLKKEAF
ncbi:MAG: DUF2851 family protein [Chitinophagaceae bacterium]